MTRLKIRCDATDIRWGRLALAVLSFALLAAEVTHELLARSVLVSARELADAPAPAASAATYRQLLRQYPLSLAAGPARQGLMRLRQEQPGSTPLPAVAAPATLPQRLLGPGVGPESADALPLWGWLCCGVALLALCFVRLGRDNTWALATLGLAALATVGTTLIWAWYGLPIGQWLSWLVRGAAPLLARPVPLALATWMLIAATVAIAIVPWRRRRLQQQQQRQQQLAQPDEDHKIRPASPTDPRMALQHLDAQKAEKRCSAAAYAHRREAILAAI